MIPNFPKFPFVINTLFNSIQTFYLTGSRFFGNYTDKSDWDLYTKYSPSMVNYLKNLGFKELWEGEVYEDGCTITVYRHPDGVDIQLVGSIAIKNKVQEYILKHFKKDELDLLRNKTYAKILWRTLVRQYKMNLNFS